LAPEKEPVVSVPQRAERVTPTYATDRQPPRATADIFRYARGFSRGHMKVLEAGLFMRNATQNRTDR